MSAPEPHLDRRDDAVLLLVQQVHTGLKDLDAKLSTHMVNYSSELASAMDAMAHKSFPGGDETGHKSHHEAVIKREEERAEFWSTMRKELAKYGLIGFFGWAAYALWTAFLQGPHK